MFIKLRLIVDCISKLSSLYLKRVQIRLKMKKIQVLCSILFVGILPSWGQSAFNMLWRDAYQHTPNNNFSSEVRELVTNQSTGDMYMLADFTSNIDLGGTPTATTYNYTSIVKYDINGSFVDIVLLDVVQHNAVGFERKSGFGLEIDQAGNLYAGYTSFNANTNYDIKISKFDASLNVLWTQTYNALSKDDGVDMVVSPASVVYAIIKSGTAATNYRYRIIKAASNLTSTSAFHTFPLGDHPSTMVMDATGNIYFTGYRAQTNGGGNSVLSGSLTSTGNTATVRWIRSDDIGGGSGDDIGRYVTLGADGFIYVAGSAQGPVQHGQDAITMKFAPINGKLQWTNVINFTLSDGAFFVEAPDLANVYTGWKGGNSVYVDRISSSGGLYTGRGVYSPVPQGSYTSITGISLDDMKISPSKGIYLSGTVSANNGSNALQAAFVSKFNFQVRATGNLTPSVVAPVEGSFQESRSNMQLALNNTFRKVYTACNQASDNSNHQQETIVISSWESPNTFRSFSETNPSNGVNAFPNPSSGIFQIDAPFGVHSIAVTDLTGRILYQFQNTSKNAKSSIDISSIPAGLYFIEVRGTDGEWEQLKVSKN